MDQINEKKPLNIGILAHVDAGKTTLTERMLYLSGSVRNLGRVDQGSAHTDFMEIEKRRGISVRAASVYFSWKGQPVNIIDTPGHSDFSAEVQRSIRAMDIAIIVVSASDGVQSQTEIFWNALRTAKIPLLFFVNKMDSVGADVEKTLEDIREILGAIPIPSLPNEKEKIVEILCGSNDILLEKYLEYGLDSIVEDELLDIYASSFWEMQTCPYITGSALLGEGVAQLLDLISNLSVSKKDEEEKDFSAVIFRLGQDPLMGRVAYARLFSGTLKNRDLVNNVNSGCHEKVVQIKKVMGSKEIDTGKASAGEIVAIYGLSRSRNGDVLGNPSNIKPEVNITTPTIRVRVTPQSDTDYPALVEAVGQISAEDPLIEVIWEKGSRELILSVTGKLQIEVIETILKERYSIEVFTGSPQVIYQERPSCRGYGFVEYTMPKPCWAVLRFEIEPLPIGSGVVFESKVRDDKIFTKYQLQVEQTIPEALRQGPKGWQVTDLKINLVDGEHHIAHTHPMDFMLATPIGIMDALINTGTDLMEPMNRFRVTYPEEMTGKIISEIIGMRGTFNSPSIKKGLAVMECRAPVAKSVDFPTRISSMTGGRGLMNTYFDGYEICPPNEGKETPFRGVSPADIEKYILHKRGAIS